MPRIDAGTRSAYHNTPACEANIKCLGKSRGTGEYALNELLVIPAKAGIERAGALMKNWTPAFAGVAQLGRGRQKRAVSA
jgi:hypothetical protein